MSTHKKRGSKLWWILLIVVLVVGVGVVQGGWFKGEAKVQIKGATVERGPLTISVLQRGNLAAKDAISIKSEIEGQTTVLTLIKEGTIVKPGDLLVDLDVSDLNEKKVAQDISLQNAESTYIKAKASYDIQESQNKSDIEAAERKLTFAQIDQRKYVEGDFDQLKKAAEEKIKLAEAELAKGKNTYDWSKNLSDRGFLTKSELDRDELDFQRAQITLEQANRALELLSRFDDPRKRTELTANLREAERGLERAKLQATSRLVDFESAVATSKSKLDLEREKFQKYVDQIGKAKIYAKEPGMVVYTRSDGGRMGGGDPMQEGSQVRERQEILTIPRTNGLIVEASVHESVLNRVAVGNRCKIRCDSIPDREFDGTVQFIAPLADKGSWWANPNQRLYRTEIQVANPVPEMRPGASCSIEILADTIPDCLSVPLQAIVLDKGKTTAFVVTRTGVDQREVKVGRSNDAKVEILAGLAAGEEVLLAPPAGFTPQGAGDTKDAPASTDAAPRNMRSGADANAPAAANGAMPGAMKPGDGGESMMPHAEASRADGASGPRPEGARDPNARKRRGDGTGTAREKGGAPREGGGGAPREGGGMAHDGAVPGEAKPASEAATPDPKRE